MSDTRHDTSDLATVRAIEGAIHSCYGSLVDPDFRNVADKLGHKPYGKLTDMLQANGVAITDTTDLNDDVSIQLVLNRSKDQVGLGLSGVGPYAALIHQDASGRYIWVTKPEDAPTPLAALTATIVTQAGLQLLGRSIVTRTIPMNHSDGLTKVTLYRALFTDTDNIP